MAEGCKKCEHYPEDGHCREIRERIINVFMICAYYRRVYVVPEKEGRNPAGEVSRLLQKTT
jgi:hypothetical protein